MSIKDGAKNRAKKIVVGVTLVTLLALWGGCDTIIPTKKTETPIYNCISPQILNVKTKKCVEPQITQAYLNLEGRIKTYANGNHGLQRDDINEEHSGTHNNVYPDQIERLVANTTGLTQEQINSLWEVLQGKKYKINVTNTEKTMYAKFVLDNNDLFFQLYFAIEQGGSILNSEGILKLYKFPNLPNGIYYLEFDQNKVFNTKYIENWKKKNFINLGYDGRIKRIGELHIDPLCPNGSYENSPDVSGRSCGY